MRFGKSFSSLFVFVFVLENVGSFHFTTCELGPLDFESKTRKSIFGHLGCSTRTGSLDALDLWILSQTAA